MKLGQLKMHKFALQIKSFVSVSLEMFIDCSIDPVNFLWVVWLHPFPSPSCPVAAGFRDGLDCGHGFSVPFGEASGLTWAKS